MWKDFKAFLMRGNVIDLATAVVIGAAFGKIVTALVDNIIMPCIGMLTSGVDFANMKYVLKEGTLNAETLEMEGEVAIGYGVLINAIIQFIIIAFVIFIVIRVMNKAKVMWMIWRKLTSNLCDYARSFAKTPAGDFPAHLPTGHQNVPHLLFDGG